MLVWISSPVRSRKAGIDKHHPAFSGADALFKIDRGATLFVHNADFNGVSLKAQSIFNGIEQIIGEGHFFGTMHFRFNYIAAAGCGVAQAASALQIVERNQTGDHAIHNPFWNLVALGIENRRIGHQVANVAHKH